MFPKGKSSSVPSDNQAKEKLANYVYEYLIHTGATKSAQTFLQEIHWDKPWAVGEPPGFLNQWWCVFFDLYNAAPERRESFEHSSEAKAFHDYGFVNSGFPNGLARNPSIASPISGGMPPSAGRPPSSQGIIPSDNGIHTPVSMPGGQMMVPNAHFFAPNHPISNLGGPGMELIRNRAMMQHSAIRYAPRGPMMSNYHPGTGIPGHRYNPQQSSGIVHSPGPSGTPQTGPPIMSSPNDSLQNEVQQNNSGQDSSFGPNGQSSRSPSHVMSQSAPAPAFPPPPASENNSEQSHNPGLMNGGTPSMPQFSQHQQSHTMEYLPSNNMSFEPPQSMKHSPQLHNPTMGDVIASMGNPMSNDPFCNNMIPNGPLPFSSEHNRMMQQHMMQQGLVPSHHGALTMQSMMPGGPSLPGSFMSHAGMPINASPQFPDYAFTSMSQAI